jgi:hypothetical protein
MGNWAHLGKTWPYNHCRKSDCSQVAVSHPPPLG